MAQWPLTLLYKNVPSLKYVVFLVNLQEELVCSDPVLARGLALVSVEEGSQSLASASLDMYALPEDEWVCAVDEDAQVHRSRVAAFLTKNLRVGESSFWGCTDMCVQQLDVHGSVLSLKCMITYEHHSRGCRRQGGNYMQGA